VNIAFIGLGQMGMPMVRNLLRAGHALRVYDVVPTAVDALVSEGATAAESAIAAARGAELAFTMLPSSPQVMEVYLGTEGLIAAASPDIALVDCSTIDPLTARQVAAAAEQRGIAMADAPVSGGTAGAQAATLTFMVGAASALFERIQPVLTQMGRNVIHCGAAGTGQTAKICNNLLLAISMIGVCEAMSLGSALGIDAKVLSDIINTSSGRCWSSDTYNPVPGILPNAPAARDYQGGFATRLMLKDLGLATDAARRAGQTVMLGSLAQQLYQLAQHQGLGDKDFSAIFTLYRQSVSPAVSPPC
jgi:3-hydroxyisobutyrate dehydrogenase